MCYVFSGIDCSVLHAVVMQYCLSSDCIWHTILGMEQIAFCKGEHAQVQSVLLLTDGLANEGIQGREGILGEMRKMQDPPVQGGVAQKVSGILMESTYRFE